jgi:membrane-associated phospholipid phosphatase
MIIMVSEIIVNEFLQSFSTPLLDLFFGIITFFGHPLPWIIVAAWLFWLGYEKRSFMLMSIILVSSLFAGFFKILIGRVRPEGILVLENQAGTYSMPSGHATLAGSIYSFYEKKIKLKTKYVAIILVILVLISRVYLGVHFVSDVLAGLLLGYILGKALCKLERKVKKSHLKVSKFSEEKLLLIIFVIMIVTVFVLPETFYLGYLLFGYYFGFVIYRDSKWKIKTENKKLNIIFGTIILGILGYISFNSSGYFGIVGFFITGLYITLGWPFILNKTKL